MGRIFETRKHTMFARWDRMAKQFSRIGKEIAIAVKAGGSDPGTNPALRRCMQNALRDVALVAIAWASWVLTPRAVRAARCVRRHSHQ